MRTIPSGRRTEAASLLRRTEVALPLCGRFQFQGGDTTELISSPKQDISASDWSPDGNSVLFLNNGTELHAFDLREKKSFFVRHRRLIRLILSLIEVHVAFCGRKGASLRHI
jgi:hypothetical protein